MISPEIPDTIWPCFAMTREVNDIVHGVIKLPHPLTDVIDTAEFQRLRHLQQLGVGARVYPSANHTRFEHSLGVGYLAGKMVGKLMRRQPELGITEVDRLCVSLAGLCHDLGHGPFSHLFDQFVLQRKPNSKWTHEFGSIQMFDLLLENNPDVNHTLRTILTDRDFIFIKECIYGPLDDGNGTDKKGEYRYKGRPIDKSFLYDIVSNKHDGLDVDRFDYMLRDSLLSGVAITFNKLGLKRLLSMARVFYSELDGCRRICYAEKAKTELEAVGSTRFHLHKVLYQHKTARACELIVVELLAAADDVLRFEGKDKKMYRMSEAVEDMQAYYRLDDSVLRTIENSTDDRLKEAKRLLADLNRRRIPHLIGMTMFTSDCLPTDDVIAQRIAERSDGAFQPSDLIVNSTYVHRGMGRVNPLECVLVYSDHKDVRANRTVHPLSSDHFRGEIPTDFGVRYLWVFCPSHKDDAFKKVAYEAFKHWCTNLSLTPIKRALSANTNAVLPAKRPRTNLDKIFD
uniref:HD/PDEase domain-containing protein n=1 Tax=Plectus sambesii TaxID=2011161 RepID=A0A914WXT2_9BILA